MIISKTPFRLSLFGGGTDFPSYYLKNGGCVIGGTIDKYCYVTARYLPDVFDFKHRIVWSKNETVKNYKDIHHPTVRSVFKLMNIKKGHEVHYQGDLQKNSGLGTSSSFCVGLINALYSLQKKNINKRNLASKAIHVEQNMLNENCGSQDQIWAAYGGFNVIKFNKKGNFEVNRIKKSKKMIRNLDQNMFLIYTGINRFSDNIEKDKIKNLDKNLNNLDKIKDIAKHFVENINNNFSIDLCASLMNDYWDIKKKLSKKVTNPFINEIYNEGINNGAIGGKVIGSGGGGFILFCCKKNKQKRFLNSLKKLPIIKFKFTDIGSEIIFRNN
jgi:D-glycero-alpha-D-manno-heptose-7-phosphate kinase